MSDGIFLKTYPFVPVNEREILRYAGVFGEADERVSALLKECLDEALPVLSYRVCYRVLDKKAAETLCAGSKLAARRLCGAESVLAFAATVGLGLDSLILRYAELSPAKALTLQALGAERIESVCDAFCAEIAEEYAKKGKKTGTRFSAGYGDFPIERQRGIFSALDCPRKIGLTLNDSLLMTPTKSVTALVPIGNVRVETEKCAACEKTDCGFRRE